MKRSAPLSRANCNPGLFVVGLLVFASFANLAYAQTSYIVESRSGGQNYAQYSETGTWSSSTGKSTASGCTAGIGSRYVTIGATAGTAIFKFTPSSGGSYEIFTTNASTTNSGNPAIHTVTHAGGSTVAAVCQNSTCTPNPCNVWYSLGTYTLNAGTQYTVTVNGATSAGSSPAGNVARADAVKWESSAPAYTELRGFWADIWGVGYKTAADIDTMVSRAVQGRYNAIFAEVLGYHDNPSSGHGAYWNSSIVPKALDIQSGLDPLSYLCQQAHAQGIQVHAWIVPYRICGSWPPAGNTTLSNHPEYFMVPRANIGSGPISYGDPAYYLDPASPDVQEYVISIIRELVTNYAIDGIQFDYIRYVQADAGYPAVSSYTKSGLERFQRITGRSDVPPASGDAAWNDFRRRSITELVRRARSEMPAMTSTRQPVRLAASVITWGNAPSNFQSSSAYGLFSNWEEWQRLGYLDTCIPMTYYTDSSDGTYYRNWVDKEMDWSYARHMVVGPGIYINPVDDSVAQIQYAEAAGAAGVCTYSYRATRNDGGNVWDWYPYVAANVFTQPAGVPTMPWRNPATATEGTVWGRVMDASSTPIDDASVQVGALSPVKTDANGYYAVTLIPASGSGTSYTVSASANGYLTGSRNSQAVAGNVRREDFSLSTGGYAPTITAQPSSIMAATGSTAVFTVQASGSTPLSYQWQKNQANVSDGGHYSGCTTAALTITGADSTDLANYRCVVTNAYGNATSSAAALTLGVWAEEYMVESRSGGVNFAEYAETGTWSSSTGKSTAAGCTQGIGSRYCTIGANTATAIFKFTPAATGSYEVFTTNASTTNSGAPLIHTVAHLSGPTDRPACQNTTCSPSASNAWLSLGTYALNAGTEYTVTANVSTGVGSAPSGNVGRSDAIKWTRVVAGTQPPTITQQPAAQNVCTGGTATFTVVASGEGTLSYRWQKNQTDLTDGGHYSGVTTATLTISGADATDAANYRCVVSNAGGSTNSNEAAFALKSPTAITQQPAAQSICPGGTATFSVVATGDGALSYQWQKNGANLTNGGHYSGVTTATLTVSSADSGDVASYQCVVTGGCGSATSNAAALSLKSATTITQQPTNKTVAAGGTATFTVAATGDGALSYQWQKNSVNLSNGGHYSGVTTATLTISSASAADAASYRCIVTAGCGSATSNQATLTVTGVITTLISDNFSYTNQSAFTTAWPISLSPGGSLSTTRYHSSAKSIYFNTTAARNYRNFTATVASDAVPIVFKYWLYDNNTGSLDRQFCEVADAAPSLTQLVAIGKYNGTGMGTYYAGRVAFAPGPNWLALDGPGAPVRSVGWHELKAVIKSTTVDFYVDGVLAKANVIYANSQGQFSFDQARLGSALSSANAAYFDDFSVVSGQ